MIDVNNLVHEFVMLALQGKGEDGKKTVILQENYDPSVGNLELCPQSFSRVLVNLANNAIETLQCRMAKKEPDYKALLQVTTENKEDGVLIHF